MKQILLFILLPLEILAQNTIAFPDIVNFPKQIYKAGLQNWDIKQDRFGKMYFANNEGLLCFDGKYWNNYPLPNKTNVRSVEISEKNKIYVGGQDELGYFSPSLNGILTYTSLTDLIPLKKRFFGDIWDITAYKGNIYFRSSTKIFKYTSQGITVFDTQNEWTYLGECNGKLYAHDFENGLMLFENDSWIPIFKQNDLASDDPVTSILSINSDSSLVTTLRNGIYILANNTLNPIQSANNQLFKTHRIYSAQLVNKNWIALGTSNNGVYIIDIKGNIIQQFTTVEGLQNNNVLSINVDSQQNLWLGLDNGIDLINYNSAIKLIKPQFQNGSGYASILFDNKLFLGTSNGLFSVPINQSTDLSFTMGTFNSIEKLKGQVWALANINNQLLVGHHEGAFVLKKNSVLPLSSTKGFWNFVPLSSTFPTSKIIAGGYFGLSIFDYKNNNFSYTTKIPDFIESSRFVVADKNEAIWISQPYHGVFKLIHNENDTYTSFTYNDKKGLPSTFNNHVYKIKNELVVATEKGVYSYNDQKDIFEPSLLYQNILGQKSIRYLKEDTDGNVWFINGKKLGIIDFSKVSPTLIYIPELTNKMLSGFEFIYPVNSNNIFIGGEKGFFHINYEKYKLTVPKLFVQLQKLVISNVQDSILFGGYYANENQNQEKNKAPQLTNNWKTFRFQYASPTYGIQDYLEYSYRLKGLDNNWSEWTNRTEKEYTNLPPGKFVFEVKVRNNLGSESEIATYPFNILPPWYKTVWAKLLYFILCLASLYFLYVYFQNKFKLQQKKYEEEQRKIRYIHELELSKSSTELITMQNDKLETEINYKNSELASTAMHLVKKGELVSKIKSELTQIVKGADSNKVEMELKKMIKSISEDDTIDTEWEKFAKHFDKVHSDFIKVLKDKHPAISNNEVKICAYLRMNLSTKEIAQLLNISARGVEISRYRLRKKLGLKTETNLFDYLINIQLAT